MTYWRPSVVVTVSSHDIIFIAISHIKSLIRSTYEMYIFILNVIRVVYMNELNVFHFAPQMYEKKCQQMNTA